MSSPVAAAKPDEPLEAPTVRPALRMRDPQPEARRLAGGEGAREGGDDGLGVLALDRAVGVEGEQES